ncbi:MAG: hypothetical protein HDT28_08310 [Clostridiales bacterium]|nr:hypothetical protein [Clostridiales bacterium]
MDSKAIIKKRAAIVALVLAFVATAIAVTAIFLPRRTVEAVANDNALDSDAMRVLSVCREYALSHDFDTEMTGAIKAKAFSIPFSQSVSGGRKVRGGGVVDTAESISTLVKAAIKKECSANKYSVSRGEYKNGAFVYSGAVEYDRDGYIAAYGLPPTGLVKYELDNAIIGAVKVDDRTYKFTLDPGGGSVYCKNEVNTVLGAKKTEYTAIEFTLITDGSRALEITSTEKFDVEKFGGTNVTAEYTEKFIYN